jgi:hypothetical protein
LGFALIDQGKVFPGWWALLPTLGAVLLIHAGPQGWVNQNILSNRALVWIGRISYPLYLWHWPLLVFAKMLSANPSGYLRFAMALLAVLLAWLTFEFVEKPLRRMNLRHLAIKLLGLFVPVGLAGYAVLVLGGIPGRSFNTPDKVAYSHYFDNTAPTWNYFQRERTLEKFNEKCNFYNLEEFLAGRDTKLPRAIAPHCHLRNPDREKSVLLWGDSHATQLSWGLQQNLPTNWQLLQIASSNCPPRLGAKTSTSDYCEQSNWFAYQTIERVKPDIVVIGQNRNHDLSQMNRMAAELKRIGIERVIFTGPTPHWTTDFPKIVLRRLWENTPRRTFEGSEQNYLTASAALKAGFVTTASQQFISITDHFCDATGCLVYLGDDKAQGITSIDNGHLSAVASDDFARTTLVPVMLATPATTTASSPR